MHLLAAAGTPLKGARAVVIGRSVLVGRPVAQLLLAADATVTMAHSRTMDLAAECRRAEVVVAAVGRAQLVRGDWISEGATVIDVGINRTAEGKLVGDVAFAEAVARGRRRLRALARGAEDAVIGYWRFEAGEEELRYRLAVKRYGRDLADRAFGRV
jgi:5,10-methylene-tetrahydrofolate dehydrogenase/methenyl tetrahydrofolate cyclohydrolase